MYGQEATHLPQLEFSFVSYIPEIVFPEYKFLRNDKMPDFALGMGEYQKCVDLDVTNAKRFRFYDLAL